MVAKNVGVLLERDEGVSARPALMGEDGDRVVCLEQFGNGVGVALESAVVLNDPVLDGGVDVDAYQHALA